jgi:Tol biopolymer transport system component
MDVTGEAVPVAEQIQIVPFAEFGYFSASSGVLIYKTAPELVSQLTWFDRQGKILGTAGEPGFYRTLALSPDGTRVAVQRGPQSRDSDIWLLDLAHGGSSRFTFSAGQHRYPAWSPDGTQVWFGSGNRIYRKAANGAGDEEPLFAGHADVRPSSWSHDGRFLLYHDLYTGAGADLWLCHLGADDKPVPFAGAGVVGMGRFSPDSRWIAYTSNESGVPEVYVRPFDPSSQSGLPPNGGKWLVSRGGGQSPRWRGDSKELFYLAPGGNVMSVEVAANPAAFQASEPKLLFKSASGSVEWDAAPDGKRFLLPVPVAQGGREEFSVILNWQAGLKK